MNFYFDLRWILAAAVEAAWVDWTLHGRKYHAVFADLIEPTLRQKSEGIRLCANALGNGSRNLFVLGNGLPGSGPNCVQPGDFVAVIAGVHTPIILRGCDGGSYAVVGAAFMDWTSQMKSGLRSISLI